MTYNTGGAAEMKWEYKSEMRAKALMKTDPTQAERFFGNRLVQGGGAWLEDGLWESCYAGA